MNTFMPYASFAASARCLDNKRLWKQCLEAKQLLAGQWPNHPASKMWRGYRPALQHYLHWCLWEWKLRGYKNRSITLVDMDEPYVTPWWLGNEAFHSTMRANLLRKAPEHYGQFGWTEQPGEGYLWPVGYNEWQDMRKCASAIS